MHWSSLRRVLTALWGCWFVLLVNEPMLLHACPMHDGMPVAAAGSMDAAIAAPAGRDAHAGHGSSHSVHSAAEPSAAEPSAAEPSAAEVHAAESATSGPSQDEEGGSHHCSCLGHCASAAAFTLPDGKAFAWLAGIIDIDAVPALAARDVVRDVEHVLPFATAPPVVTRA